MFCQLLMKTELGRGGVASVQGTITTSIRVLPKNSGSKIKILTFFPLKKSRNSEIKVCFSSHPVKETEIRDRWRERAARRPCGCVCLQNLPFQNTSGSAAVKTIGGRPDGTQISQVREKCPSKSLTAALDIITQLLSRNRLVP